MNQNKYITEEGLRKELIIRAGYFKVHTHLDGRTSLEADSISFGSMDEDTFSQLYQRVLDVVFDQFLPDVDPDQLEEEVAKYAGFF